MTTLNGFIRSATATARRIDRANQRQQRETARQYKQQLKHQELLNSAELARKYDDYLDLILSVHKECSAFVDWTAIGNEREPVKPVKDDAKERFAITLRESYQPSFFDKLFGIHKRRIKQLDLAIVVAAGSDEHSYKQRLQEYQEDFEEWNTLQKLARGIALRDRVSYKKAVMHFNPFSAIGELGTNVSMSFENDRVIRQTR